MTHHLAKHIGFTGTRKGLTSAAELQLREVIKSLAGPGDWLHHGCCRGADIAANYIAMDNQMLIHQHPGERRPGQPDPFEGVGWAQREHPKANLERNRDIVNACRILVACPLRRLQDTASGTWFTINYARKMGKQVMIIHRDGSVGFT